MLWRRVFFTRKQDVIPTDIYSNIPHSQGDIKGFSRITFARLMLDTYTRRNFVYYTKGRVYDHLNHNYCILRWVEVYRKTTSKESFNERAHLLHQQWRWVEPVPINFLGKSRFRRDKLISQDSEVLAIVLINKAIWVG